MSTLDVLNAISEAREALIRLPELEATIRSLTDDRDFVKLERDEAERTIERLKARISELENSLAQKVVDNATQSVEISDLKARNESLDQSHRDLTVAYNNAQATIMEKDILINTLNQSNTMLTLRLEDAKGYGERLAETLKGIGQSIVKAVEVPEVTSDKPFPVDNTVGLSGETNVSPDGNVSLMVDPVVAESTGEAVVESPKEDTAAGCFPYRYW